MFEHCWIWWGAWNVFRSNQYLGDSSWITQGANGSYNGPIKKSWLATWEKNLLSRAKFIKCNANHSIRTNPYKNGGVQSSSKCNHRLLTNILCKGHPYWKDSSIRAHAGNIIIHDMSHTNTWFARRLCTNAWSPMDEHGIWLTDNRE